MPGAGPRKVTYDSLYRYTVDSNRRVQMPLPWRPDKPVEFTMIVWPQTDTGPCLRVLGPDEMEKLREKIATLPPAEKTVLKRQIGNCSVRFTLDAANRLALPSEMADAAGIRGEAVFAGMLDYFEIWVPERYAEMNAAQKPSLHRAIQLLEWKTSRVSLWTMGKSLFRMDDRKGIYKLPTGNAIPHFGSGGRTGAVHPPAVRPAGPAEQAGLFGGEESPPAPIAVSAPQSAPPPSPAVPKAPTAAAVSPILAAPPKKSIFRRLVGALTAPVKKVWTLVSWLNPRSSSESVFKSRRRALAFDFRPRAQGELALEKITVLRNDLSESDLVVVNQSGGEPANSSHAKPRMGVAARWIDLKRPEERSTSAMLSERPASLAELKS